MGNIWNKVGGYHMTIENITYEITAANEELRCMEVVFRAPGYPDVLVGARMPFEGESLDSLIASFAPILHWEEISKQVVPVTVGATGAVTLTSTVATDNVSVM